MNEKVQQTIDNILARKERWPEIYIDYSANPEIRTQRIRDRLADIFSKHSKMEWAFIYKECSKHSEYLYADIRTLADETGDWYQNCYRNKDIVKGRYPYIPYDPCSFYRHMTELSKKYNLKSFLDVGAGYGDKVLIAKDIFEIAHGIEYVPDYVNTAKSFGVDLIQGDAFTFGDYKNYDLLYLYHPIHDCDMYDALINHLFKQMKPGGYIIEVYDPGREFYEVFNKRKLELKLLGIRMAKYTDSPKHYKLVYKKKK